MTKTEWRKKTKKLLTSMDEKDRKDRSEKIADHLYQTEQWLNCERIGITVSRNFELDTYSIIETAWKEGKKVCVPKCYSDGKKMEFRELSSYDELENVYMDLYEPITAKTETVPSESIDLLVVPGLVFDLSGYRIGYGGGYYDRYLVNYTGATVALAFCDQIAEQLPHEDFDIPVQQVITETGTIM